MKYLMTWHKVHLMLQTMSYMTAHWPGVVTCLLACIDKEICWYYQMVLMLQIEHCFKVNLNHLIITGVLSATKICICLGDS